MNSSRPSLSGAQLPAQEAPGDAAYSAAFQELEGQQLAARWLLFAPVTALLLTLTEVAPFFTPEFPSAPLLTGSIVALMAGMYLLARSKPRRAVIGWATAVMGVIGGGYAGSAAALSGMFVSPHALAMAVVVALLPGMLSVSVAEAFVTAVGGIAAWGLVIFGMSGKNMDYAGMITCLVYLSFLTLVTLLSVLRNRQLRYSEFAARSELERMHRFTVEEVLFRHLPTPYVEQVLSGARTVDQAPERRLVTIVFADIVGFSGMTEALPPEQLAQLLARFYDLISTAAAKYEATMDKFMGDAAMVFLGAPDAMSPQQQALRALEMACEWQYGVPSLHYLPQPLTLRIGIHQDVVTVGSFGGRLRTDYTILGRGVNIAARLQRLCRPGRIVVSRELAAWFPQRHSWKDLGLQELRGVAEPVQVYEVNPGRMRAALAQGEAAAAASVSAPESDAL